MTETEYSDIWQNLDTSYRSFERYYEAHLDEVLERFHLKKYTKYNDDGTITYMIHLGYLGYDQNRRSAFVPNEEIRQELTLAVREIVV